MEAPTKGFEISPLVPTPVGFNEEELQNFLQENNVSLDAFAKSGQGPLYFIKPELFEYIEFLGVCMIPSSWPGSAHTHLIHPLRAWFLLHVQGLHAWCLLQALRGGEQQLRGWRFLRGQQLLRHTVARPAGL